MEKKLSSGTIHTATVIKAITDLNTHNGWVHLNNIKKLVNAPVGYPWASMLSNSCKKGYLKKEIPTHGRQIVHYAVDDKGFTYLKNHEEYIQTYGNYELVYTEGTPRKSTKKVQQPAVPELTTYAPAVMEAMKRLESLAVINEQCRHALYNIKMEVERFRLLDTPTDQEVDGMLRPVLESTIEYKHIITTIESLVGNVDKE